MNMAALARRERHETVPGPLRHPRAPRGSLADASRPQGVLSTKRFEDAQPFMRMMPFECGFRLIGVPYTWRARRHGVSRNRFSQLVDQGLNGLISFSTVPLRVALFLGFGVAVLSFPYARKRPLVIERERINF
jgi:hypothetical protein